MCALHELLVPYADSLGANIVNLQEARRALSESLANFVPSIMQNGSQIASRLELFRTETLASFEPADKKRDTTNPVIDDIESTMALDNFIVTELPTVNTRAGLYIYLNALVRS